MKSLPSVLQFIIGFLLGITLFVGGITLLGYLVVSRFAATPQRPVFPEEVAQKTKPAPPKNKTTPAPQTSPQTPVAASPSPSPSPSPTLPPNAYNAKVTWNEGLSLRSLPSRDSARVDGVGYNEPVIVLETQGEWVKIRIPNTTREGWVRQGNLQRVD